MARCCRPVFPGVSVRSAPSSLRGRFAVVTGGSAGIGRALAAAARRRRRVRARGLAASGAGEVRASRARSRLQGLGAAFADGLLRDGRPIDLLVLNAGVHVPWKTVTTADGAGAALAGELPVQLPARPSAAGPVPPLALRRVVYVASEAHRLAALPGAPLLGFWYRYAKSKEAAVTSFLRLAELHPELTVRDRLAGLRRLRDPPAQEPARRPARARLVPAARRGGGRARGPGVQRPGGGRGVYWDRGAPRQPEPALPGRRARGPRCGRPSLDAARGRLPGARAPERDHQLRADVPRARARDRASGHAWRSWRAVVRRAAEDGKGVRVVGRRHSYNDGFFSPTCMVSLERLDRVVDLDPEREDDHLRGRHLHRRRRPVPRRARLRAALLRQLRTADPGRRPGHGHPRLRPRGWRDVGARPRRDPGPRRRPPRPRPATSATCARSG